MLPDKVGLVGGQQVVTMSYVQHGDYLYLWIGQCFKPASLIIKKMCQVVQLCILSFEDDIITRPQSDSFTHFILLKNQ